MERNCDDSGKMRIYGEERGRLLNQKAGQELLMGGVVSGVSAFSLFQLIGNGRPLAECVPFGLSIVFMTISGFLSAVELNAQIEAWDRWIVSTESKVQYVGEGSLVPYLNRISIMFMAFGIVFTLVMSTGW